jgi:hypothetical protein
MTNEQLYDEWFEYITGIRENGTPLFVAKTVTAVIVADMLSPQARRATREQFAKIWGRP